MYKTELFETLAKCLTPEWYSVKEGLSKKRLTEAKKISSGYKLAILLPSLFKEIALSGKDFPRQHLPQKAAL